MFGIVSKEFHGSVPAEKFDLYSSPDTVPWATLLDAPSVIEKVWLSPCNIKRV